MNNEIRFNEDSSSFPEGQGKKRIRGFGEKLANWFIKYSGGLIKNEKQAYIVILVIIILLFIVNFILLAGAGGVNKPLYKEDIMSPDGIPIRAK